MKNFNFKLRYTKTQKSTDLELEGKYESVDKQDGQSSKKVLGLVLDYLPLVISLYQIVVPYVNEAINLII
ncbi:hypothetical protein QMU85_003316 [Photobacterium damselae]|nr:hypothetical protein [Photobacterium damselae]